MVSAVGNTWQQKLLQVEPECLAHCRCDELITGREIKFPPQFLPMPFSGSVRLRIAAATDVQLRIMSQIASADGTASVLSCAESSA